MDIFYVLLALLPCFLTQTEASLSCDEVSTDCECLKSYTKRELQLVCPTRTTNEAVIKYDTFSVKITCFNQSFNIGALDLKMNNFSAVKMQNCWRIDGLLFDQLREDLELRELVISGSNLQDSQVKLLHESINLLSIKIVNLEKNNLTNFPEFLTYVEELDLSNNLIKEIPDRIRSSSLFRLIMKGNYIENLSDSLFEDAPNLKYLDLSHNRIAKLPPKLMHPLRDLRVLVLSSNNFQEIPHGFFQKNSALKDVWLSNGHLHEIGSNMFSNCTWLQRLKLSNNSIKALPKEMFLNMNNLTYLDLSRNLLSDLEYDAFKGLLRLEQLYLFQNRLTGWFQDYNEDLKFLKRLSLSNNSLSEIERDTFMDLEKLQVLDLSHNVIVDVEVSAFANLKNLKDLNLSFNKLRTVDSITNSPFGKPTLKKKINLSYNNISYVKMPTESEGLSSTTSAPKFLCLFENPISCDCDNLDLLKHLKSQESQHKSIKISCDIQCATPSKWKGTKLNDLVFDDFSCQVSQFYDCPDNCACEIYPFTGSFKIDCSNGGLRDAPVLPALKKSFSEIGVDVPTITVNLTNNSISEFTDKDWSYVGVDVLDLSNNDLKKFHWIPPNVKVLNLENNEISKLDRHTVVLLNQSTTLNSLTLENNPWVCDCDAAYLADVLRTNLKKLLPSSNFNISCVDGSPLLDITEESVCSSINETLLSLTIVFSLVGILTIVFTILLIYFQDYVKIWLYNHKLMLFLNGETDLDPDKIYDAFISYSHKDEEFVAKNLAPELENGPEKYKLCLHERDWIVGEYIPTQISDSVQNSRRTIIVLSRNFLESDWATMEFKTAHMKSIREEKNRLIIILYEDIDVNEVQDEEMKIYLTTKTYIKWGDPWFWKKLRQSLPSRRARKMDGKNKYRSKINDIERCVDT